MRDDRDRRTDPGLAGLGLLSLAAFVWSFTAGQYEDLDGDQHRALFTGKDNAPAAPDSAGELRHRSGQCEALMVSRTGSVPEIRTVLTTIPSSVQVNRNCRAP